MKVKVEKAGTELELRRISYEDEHGTFVRTMTIEQVMYFALALGRAAAAQVDAVEADLVTGRFNTLLGRPAEFIVFDFKTKT